MRNWFALTVILFVVIALVGTLACETVSAQDEAPAAKTEEKAKIKSVSLFKLIKDGGPIEWFIILLSVAALALIIENFVTMKVENYLPQDLMMLLRTLTMRALR